MMLVAGCSAPANTVSQSGTAQAMASGCRVDTAKICEDARSAGTLEAPPAPLGYVASQSTMPDTAHVAIPNGPSLQVMCYYNPQHSALSRSDWNSSAPLDSGAASFLKTKGYCAP